MRGSPRSEGAGAFKWGRGNEPNLASSVAFASDMRPPDYPDTSSCRHKFLILQAPILRAGGSNGAESSAVSKGAQPPRRVL